MISLIKSFGHRFVPILPALCGFEAEGMEFSKVSGVRTDALLSLYIDGQKCEQERGELQLADYGISGIPVFQVSSPASKALYQKKQAELTINFLPDFSEDMLTQELQRRFSRDAGIQDAAESLRGLPLQLRRLQGSGAAQLGAGDRQGGLQVPQYLPGQRPGADRRVGRACRKAPGRGRNVLLTFLYYKEVLV